MLGYGIPNWSHGIIQRAIGHQAWLCVKVLLCWGFYSYELSSCSPVLHDATAETSSHPPATSVFHAAVAKTAPVEILGLLIALKPVCLQEDWLVTGNLPVDSDTACMAQIIEARKHPPTLDNLCRANIIQCLGFNPVPKVMQLPLPNVLKDFLAVVLPSV